MKICSNITVLPSLFKLSNSSVRNTIFVWCGKLTFVVKNLENHEQQLFVKNVFPEKWYTFFFLCMDRIKAEMY